MDGQIVPKDFGKFGNMFLNNIMKCGFQHLIPMFPFLLLVKNQTCVGPDLLEFTLITKNLWRNSKLERKGIM